MKQKPDEKIMLKAMANPKYKGQHIIVVKDQVYSAQTGPQVNKVLEEVIKKYPKETPIVGYIPKEDSLILLFK